MGFKKDPTRPKGVRAVYDDGRKYWDRYTIIYDAYEDHPGLYPYVGSSDDPCNPLGFFQHGELRNPGKHLGKRIPFASLPEEVKRAVIRDLEAEA